MPRSSHPTDESPPAGSLRRGHPQDAPEVAEIWRRGWRDAHRGLVPQPLLDARSDESFATRAQRRIGEMTVAVVNGDVAGFVLVVEDELEQVYVAASQRGTGIAARLLADAERQIRANGHPRGWLAVVAGNRRARNFYERAGWRDEGPFEYQAAVDEGSIPVPCRRYVKNFSW